MAVLLLPQVVAEVAEKPLTGAGESLRLGLCRVALASRADGGGGEGEGLVSGGGVVMI